jgi:hypothetical protein
MSLFVFNPCSLFLIAKRAVLALVGLFICVTVLHVLLQGELAGEPTLAFRALMQFLPARMLTQPMVHQVASLLEFQWTVCALKWSLLRVDTRSQNGLSRLRMMYKAASAFQVGLRSSREGAIHAS